MSSSTDPSNATIAAALDELGDLYELDGAVVHRVVAYRNGAKAVRDAPTSVAEMTRAGTVTSLPGIGKTLAEKIAALLETGTIPAAEKLRAQYPAGVVAMTRLPGLGPKRARRLHAELGIDSLEALGDAARAGRLSSVKGFGAKFEQTVLEALASGVTEAPAPRMVLSRAREIAGEIIDELVALVPEIERIEAAGGIRRWAETVKDIDIVAAAPDPAAVARALTDVPMIDAATAGTPGEHAARAMTHNGAAVDLRVVTPDRYGNLLQHFTGSARHNTHLREQSVRRGLHISEYGILDDADGQTVHCATEAAVYERLGLPWIPPELREDRGELEPGFTVPELVTVDDLRGDLHCHTVASDGRNTVVEMAEGAIARGYEYLVITDHSATHGFGDDVPPDALRRQIEWVRELDERLGDDLTLLIGTETNILPNGSPDYDDDLLAQLDWVVGSVHTSFGLARDAMTARLIAAIEHPYVDCIGHLTGRKLSGRPPYELDVDAVIAAAARTGTFLEINGSPDRRDLNEVHARAAHAAGVRIVIDSDAHGVSTQHLIEYGVATARRAGLTAADIANAQPWPTLAPQLKRARA